MTHAQPDDAIRPAQPSELEHVEHASSLHGVGEVQGGDDAQPLSFSPRNRR